MSNDPIHIKVESEEELVELAEEMLHIITNLRYWSKEWSSKYGVDAKRRMKYWEARADELLANRNVPKYERQEQLKIQIQKTEQ